MKNPSLTIACGALLALGMATPAIAQSAPRASFRSFPINSSGLPSFRSLDRHHRGYLTRNDIPKDAEGMQELRAHFRENDRDHNGRLNPNEYAVYVMNQAPAYEPTPRTSADMDVGTAAPDSGSMAH